MPNKKLSDLREELEELNILEPKSKKEDYAQVSIKLPLEESKDLILHCNKLGIPVSVFCRLIIIEHIRALLVKEKGGGL